LIVGFNGTGDSSLETTNSSLKTLSKIGTRSRKKLNPKMLPEGGNSTLSSLPYRAKADATVSSFVMLALYLEEHFVTPLKGGNGSIYCIFLEVPIMA
jgi:flagellar basal body P-ring protein FlgI